MPLIPGYSKEVVKENIATEIRAERPMAQAVAMSLRSARKAWRARHPVGPFPKHLQSSAMYRAQRSNRAGPKKLVCRCDAYKFPHMPGGGACMTNRIVPQAKRRFAPSGEFVAFFVVEDPSKTFISPLPDGGMVVHAGPSLSTARVKAKIAADQYKIPVGVFDDQMKLITTYWPGSPSRTTVVPRSGRDVTWFDRS